MEALNRAADINWEDKIKQLNSIYNQFIAPKP
jgi:hypothetical protein